MIDANQDKKCERNNQIVESLEKFFGEDEKAKIPFPDFTRLQWLLDDLLETVKRKNKEFEEKNGSLSNSP